MDADALMRRDEKLVALRSNWDNLWERVAQLVLPRLDSFQKKRSPGTSQNLQQYDAFTMGALDKFNAAIEAGLMPRSTLWHHLITGDEETDDNHEVKVYCEALNKTMWDTRYSPLGNFASQAYEVRTSLGAFGTGPMLVEARDGGGIRYRAFHLSEIYISDNNEGLIDVVHRRFCLSARQAVQEFRDKTPDKVMKAYQKGEVHQEFEFTHCVGPREDFEPGRLDAQGAEFAGYYLFNDERKIVKEEAFFEMPYMVPRYSTSPREVYGRSPAIQMLPDISMLNEMKRTVIEQAALSVDPPTLSHADVSEFDLTAGTHNPGTVDENGRPMVLPWNSGTEPAITQELMADVRNQIDDGFLGIYFRVLVENPQMTATQAMLVAQQQGQMSSPVVGRLQSEWLGPMIRRESAILYRQGKHPPMPDALRRYVEKTGKGLEIEYQSPLTRAARADEAVGILRAFETLAPIAQIDPTVYDVFDTAEVARIVSEVNGVPAKALKSPERLLAEANSKAQAAEMGAILQAAPIAAETAKTLAEARNLSQAVPAQ